VDAGAKFKNYNCDVCRTYCQGKTEQFRKIYEAVLEAQKAGISECYPGNKIKKADEAVRKVLRKHGYEEFFLHSSGHGIGLEVHEEPRIKKNAEGIFKKGMVVTIEPGVYKGLGVRMEDVILVDKKPRVLTNPAHLS
jgi:Xaa-Pro dipeptidase